LDIIFIDELGQLSSDLMAILDIVLRKLRNSNVYFGGVLLVFTLDHTQILPYDARPFLTSTNLISCFRMVLLTKSVRAADDNALQRVQEISRYPFWYLVENSAVIEEFLQLISNHFTFCQDWLSPLITPDTFRLYSKRVPAKEAARQFVERVERHVQPSELLFASANDVEKARYSHSEWRPASQATIDQLEQKLKEPNKLLFFKFARYEFTYNEEGKYSQSQMAILYDLPTQYDVDGFKKINVLAAPPGGNNVDFDETMSKQDFLELGFKEVKVGCAPDRIRVLKQNIQARRKQYGLRHRVTNTINASQGETLNRMATEISQHDPNFSVWDKGQLVVLLSRTKRAVDTIFVGNKADTLDALKTVLLKKTQWSDYIERVLDLVTVNQDENQVHQTEPSIIMNSFPFRICDIALPQCRTGFVYFLISLKNRQYTYIGHCQCLRERLPQHNSGYGSESTAPEHLRPYGIMAYICGFEDGKKELRLHLERSWKLKRDRMIERGFNDPREWARAGQSVINDVVGCDAFNVDSSDLKLVCHFRDVI
jgi:predicted GIY-YIG superfamily endonuclease/molybdopterin converting factor small subunit